MRNIIVGTAGHVDHGKTTLIKALTGKNTDRLKEEQKRGITIELGFADMTAPDGTDIGIIDVPGHEKFIKNMLAGIGGIDIVLLVVAADEGVMPQTVEHLDIMRLLNIKRGIIVITKADMVEPEWLEMIEADTRKACEGSFLENASCIAVSGVTGQGIEELRNMLFDMIKTAPPKNNNPKLLRIPIDRVFTIDGFGTVITGTLLQGKIDQGQDVIIYPQGIEARVRNIQVHNKMVDSAFAGQRTAVNLNGVKKEDLSRGNVLAFPGTIKPSNRIDVRLNMLPDTKRVISSGDSLHFYYGAEETKAKLTLLDAASLTGGQSCYAQLYFDEAVALKKDDLFVIRFMTPVETIGGGVVLDAEAERHKKGDVSVIEALKIRESGSGNAVFEQALKDGSKSFVKLDALAKQIGITDEEANEFADELESLGRAYRISDNLVISKDFVDFAESEGLKILKDFHGKNKLTAGMIKEEFKTKLASSLKLNGATQNVDALLEILGNGNIIISGNLAKAADFNVVYTKNQEKILKEICDTYTKSGIEPPDLATVIGGYKDKNEAKQLVASLISEGKLVRLNPDINIKSEILSEAKDFVVKTIQNEGGITLAKFRDNFQTSRKFALYILEYLDLKKITRLDGEIRVFY